MGAYGGLLVGVVWVAFFVFAIWRLVTRRRRGGLGAGAAGAYYDMLNKDRREAVQVVLEKRAEKQDPETKDGKPPLREVP
jgi:hypothetical protein